MRRASPSTAASTRRGPTANCVMHTHTRAGTGVSVLKKGLRPISQGRARRSRRPRLPRVRHADLAGGVRCAGRELPETAARSCVAQPWASVGGAPTVPAALRRLYMLERACEVEIIARSLDEAPRRPSRTTSFSNTLRAAKAYRASPEFGMGRLEGSTSPDRRQGAATGGSRAPLKSDRGSSGPGFTRPAPAHCASSGREAGREARGPTTVKKHGDSA